MANQEWDSWIQRQGTIKKEPPELDRNQIVASSTFGSEHWSTSPEGTGEDVICPSSRSSPYFPFEESSFELNDPSFPFDDPAFPLDEPNLFLQSSPSPKLEPIIQSLPEVAESHTGQPCLAETKNSSWQGPATNDCLPGQVEETSTPALPAYSAPSRSRKRKNKKRKSSMDGGVPKARRQRGYRLDSHNEIEKRYRTGINECIDRLRQAIPLQVPKDNECKFDEEDDGSITERESEATRSKDGKGDVLTRALEYIKHLEADSSRLCNEVVVLNTRLRAFGELAMNGTVSLDKVRLRRPA